MTTAPKVLPARQAYLQEEYLVAGVYGVAYDDVALAAGTLKIGKVPQDVFITRGIVEVVTAFAATTTNTLTVGTVSGTASTVITAGDVNETVAGINLVAAKGVLSTTADLTLYAKFAGAGTANTAGAASILVFGVDMKNL
jgi:hypothetical protein